MRGFFVATLLFVQLYLDLVQVFLYIIEYKIKQIWLNHLPQRIESTPFNPFSHDKWAKHSTPITAYGRCSTRKSQSKTCVKFACLMALFWCVTFVSTKKQHKSHSLNLPVLSNRIYQHFTRSTHPRPLHTCYQLYRAIALNWNKCQIRLNRCHRDASSASPIFCWACPQLSAKPIISLRKPARKTRLYREKNATKRWKCIKRGGLCENKLKRLGDMDILFLCFCNAHIL